MNKHNADGSPQRKCIINREMGPSLLFHLLLHTPELIRWVQGPLHTVISRSEPKVIECMKIHYVWTDFSYITATERGGVWQMICVPICENFCHTSRLLSHFLSHLSINYTMKVHKREKTVKQQTSFFQEKLFYSINRRRKWRFANCKMTCFSVFT